MLLLIFHPGRTCKKNIGYPVVEIQGVNKQGLVLIPQFSFPCDGKLNTIEYYANAIAPFNLGVWRWNAGGHSASLLYMVSIHPFEIGHQQTQLNESLIVEKSDFIGLWTKNELDHLPIPFAAEYEIGTLKSDLQDIILNKPFTQHVLPNQGVSLLEGNITKMVIPMNIHYKPTKTKEGK